MSADAASCDRPCPVCGSTSAEAFFTWQSWRVSRCGDCSMVYLSNPISYESVATTYAWNASFAAESKARRKREPLLHAVQQVFRPLTRRLRHDRLASLFQRYDMRGRLLDLGCGDGRRLLSKLRPGTTPLGVEIEPGPAARADHAFRQHGGQAWCAPAHDVLLQLDDASVDCAMLHAYLEHEIQPRAVLCELARVLRPAAAVIIKVPNHASFNRHLRGRRWCGYRFPDHLNYFTPATAGSLLERCGFEVVQSRFWDHLPTSDNLWVVARRRQ